LGSLVFRNGEDMKRLIYRGSLFLFFNGVISLLAVLLILSIFHGLSVDRAIDWSQLHTKIFAALTGSVFFLMCLTYKYQMLYFEREHAAARMTNTRYFRVFYSFLFMLMSSFMLYAVLQLFQNAMNVDLFIDWTQGKTKIFILSSLFVFCFYLFFFSITGRLYLSFILSFFIAVLFGLTHFNKMTFLGEPLYPSDFKQVTHILEVIPMVLGSFAVWKLLLALVVLVLVLGYVAILYSQLNEIKGTWWVRGILLSLSIFIFYSFFHYPKTYVKAWAEQSDVKIIRWNQPSNYRDNGFVFGFLSNLHVDAFDKPAGYNKKAVLEIANRILKNSNEIQLAESRSKEKPNIVFIMSEAFWDPTKLERVTFSEDPLKITRSLMKEHSSGSILSPTFGGGTANVEFEALTGFSMRFLKAGSLPYQQLIDQKDFVPSIVSELEARNYESIAMHPYNKVFYKRNRVYDTFGFNEFLHMNSMKNKETTGPYISDESVTNEIMDNLKKKEQPVFLHAVTMQNHFPYAEDRYAERSIKVSGLSEKSNVELEVYAEGISQSDKALGLLVEKLEDFKEPTVVVLWGDHLPILGQNKAIYEEAKFMEPYNPKVELQKFSETPLLMYSNYDIPKEELKVMSPAFIGPTLFNLAGLEQSPFYTFLEEVKKELPGIKPGLLINSGQKSMFDLNKEQQQLLKDYQLLQYDLLVGKQYSSDILFK
jgi:phosphoglycerol transferase MdoB-like AlkP superfamily enzyme